MPSAGAPTVADLLAHAGWVRALARHLVHDRDAAEDVTQDAFVTALRRPPARAGAARAWLARVVANLAKQRGRARIARERRESHAAAADAAPPADDVVARAELHRMLTDLVLGLAEPYRGAVLARFFAGESHERIAAREGVPASTVRNRVARGVGLLRVRLDAQSGGARERWLPMAAALAVPAPGTAPLGHTWPLLTTRIMASLAKLTLGTAAALLLAGTIWLVWRTTASEAPRATPLETEARTGAESTARPVARAAESRPRAGSAPRGAASLGATSTARAQAPLPAGTLEVVVETEGGPAPAAVAHVQPTTVLLPPPYAPRAPDGWRCALDQDGVARFRGLAANVYAAALELPDGLVLHSSEQFALQPGGAGRRCVFRFGTASVYGHAYDADGRPTPGIAVQVESDGWICYRETDAAGRYEVGRLTAGVHWVGLPSDVGTKLSLGQPLMQEVPYQRDAAQRVDFGSPQGLPTWSGAIRTTGTAPLLAAALLHLKRSGDGRYQQLTTRADGTFAFRIEPGAWNVALTAPCVLAGTGAWPNSRQRIDQPLELRATAVQRDLTLAGTRVRVRVTVAPGADPRIDSLSVSAHPPQSDPGACVATPLGNRTWAFEGLPAGTWVLTSWPREPTAPREIVVRASDVELQAELEVR